MVIAGGYHLMNLNQLNKELEIQQAAQLWSVNLTGLTVRVDVVLKNPTPGQVSVKTPYITISYNGTPLASNDTISGTNHQIPPYGMVALDPIYITLKYLTLAVSAKKFYAQYMNTGRATVTVRALTRINEVFPVEQSIDFDLGDSAPTQGSTTGKVATVPTVKSLATSVTPRIVAPVPAAAVPRVQAVRAVAQPLPAARKTTTTVKRAAVTAKRPATAGKKTAAVKRPAAAAKLKSGKKA